MSTVLLACSMMEDEIRAAMEELHVHYPVVWMDRGLHDQPAQLHSCLQQKIDTLQDADTILLAFGLCGNGTAGLQSSAAKLVIPRFDDCINALLCTGTRTQRMLAQPGVLYLTRGWTQDNQFLLHQFDALKAQCDDDEELLEDMIQMMYGNYHHISVVDTGVCSTASTVEYAGRAAELLHLCVRTEAGSNRILRQLLSGDWDDNFIVLSPGKVLTPPHFDFPPAH